MIQLFVLSLIVGVVGFIFGLFMTFSVKTRKTGLYTMLVSVIILIVGLGSCALILNSISIH